MNQLERFNEIINRYSAHGWRLARVLVRPETRAELGSAQKPLADVTWEDATVDALWFARASHAGREACDSRMWTESRLGLFETLEAYEEKGDGRAVRGEVGAGLGDFTSRA